MSMIKDKLKKYAEQDTVLMTVIIVLVFLVCIFFPLPFESDRGVLIASFLLRFVFCIIGIILSLALGFCDTIMLKRMSFLTIFAFLSGILLGISNFPLFELSFGKARFIARADEVVLYIVYCASVAAFEEIFFRGLVLPLFLIRFDRLRWGKVMAIMASAAVFGGVHLFNLFAGASIGAVMLQVGYTFLVGLLCGAVFYTSKSIIPPIIIHLIYNLGGLLTSFDIISGTIWSIPSIVFMTVAAVISATICTIAVLKTSSNELSNTPKNID